jgi:hypothetical protein
VTDGRTRTFFANLAFEDGVEVAESGSGLSRFAQHFAAPESCQIFGGVVKTKLMNRAVRIEQLKVSIFKFGVHLQDGSAFGRILKRLQNQSTPLYISMLPIAGKRQRMVSYTAFHLRCQYYFY